MVCQVIERELAQTAGRDEKERRAALRHAEAEKQIDEKIAAAKAKTSLRHLGRSLILMFGARRRPDGPGRVRGRRGRRGALRRGGATASVPISL